GFGGIGIGPQTPELPFLICAASVSTPPSTPAFFAAMSFSEGPTIFIAMLWQAPQVLVLNKSSPEAVVAAGKVAMASTAARGIRAFFMGRSSSRFGRLALVWE